MKRPPPSAADEVADEKAEKAPDLKADKPSARGIKAASTTTKVAKDAGPPRERGAPSLGLTVKPGSVSGGSWSCGAAATAVLELVATSAGGPATGVYVELGGPAFMSGLLAADGVEVAGHKGTFEKKGATARAELREAKLEAGFVQPERGKGAPPPLPNPTVEVKVTIKGEKAGQGLLTVRVGPMGTTGSAGSAMQGKTLIVA